MLDKMCNAGTRATLPRVPAFDHPQSMGRVARHADMLENMCNFTSRSCVRPRQSMGRVARHVENVQLYLAFNRSTTPIHGKGCASRRHVGKNVQLYLAFVRLTTPIQRKGCASCRKCATLPRVQAFDHANPWEGLRVTPTCWKIFATLPRVRAFDHANPWEGLRVMPKMCNFTSRSNVRPRQSMGRVARHGDMLGKFCNFTSRSCV